MRRVLALLLVLLALSACGAGVPPEEPGAVLEEPDTPPAEPAPKPEHPDTALPELKAAEPLSAPALVTEGRAPAEDYRLPPSVDGDPVKLVENFQDWAHSGNAAGLLGEVPEADAAFYGLPLLVSGLETVKALIRWGDSLAEFDWDFLTPRRFLPRMAVMDLDGDGKDELIVLTYVGSGTGVSIYDLHVLEKNPAGTLTDYAMPGSLWQERLPPLLRFVQTDGRNFLILGRELLEIDMEHVLEGQMEPSAGWIANFRLLPEEHAIQLLGAVDLWKTTNYVADYTADVGYRDGVFTLSGFHLQ